MDIKTLLNYLSTMKKEREDAKHIRNTENRQIAYNLEQNNVYNTLDNC